MTNEEISAQVAEDRVRREIAYAMEMVGARMKLQDARVNELIARNNQLLEEKRTAEAALAEATMPMETFLHRKHRWSLETFGAGGRPDAIVAHIRKELAEVLADPTDLEEWIDVALLAQDGYMRNGGRAEVWQRDMLAKFHKNLARNWVKQPEGHYEHDRTNEA